MSVKSDRWIKRMALEHGMIRPFEDRQVRQGVVSYGVSSYGYDIRVADEFKIFTNINSTLIDPKNLDTRSFVDLKADVKLDVPGNSGIQVRSHQTDKGRVFGYQCEIDPSARAWSGGIYDEGRGETGEEVLEALPFVGEHLGRLRKRVQDVAELRLTRDERRRELVEVVDELGQLLVLRCERRDDLAHLIERVVQRRSLALEIV